MADKVTTDVIITWLKEAVESKTPISPVTFLDAAVKLSALLSDETDRLIDLERMVAQHRVKLLEMQDERNVSEVKMVVEASQLYSDMRKQRAKVDQIHEFILLAKKYATVKDREYGAGL